MGSISQKLFSDFPNSVGREAETYVGFPVVGMWMVMLEPEGSSPWPLELILFFIIIIQVSLFWYFVLCPMSESLSGKRECFQDNATRIKGKFIADSSQGSCRVSNAVVRGQRALSPSCYPIYKVCISSWFLAWADWLHVCKVILLAQSFPGFFQTWALEGFSAFPW